MTFGSNREWLIERINTGIKSVNLPDDYVDQWIRPFVPENELVKI